MVATLVRTIFAQPDASSVWDQRVRHVEQLTERFPAAAELLTDAAVARRIRRSVRVQQGVFGPR
jgi:hypothetical protein